MQEQRQRIWWPAWKRGDDLSSSSTASPTAVEAPPSLQRFAPRSPGISSCSLDREIHASQGSQEGVQEHGQLPALLVSSATAFAVPEGNDNPSDPVARPISELLLNLHKKSAGMSMPMSRRQADSSQQQQQQQQQQLLHIEHRRTHKCQPDHLSATAGQTSTVAGCSKFLPIKQPDGIKDRPQTAYSVLQASSRPSGRHADQVELGPRSSTLFSPHPDSDQASTAIAFSPSDQLQRAVPALRPHTVSSSSPSRVLQQADDQQRQSSSRAASIFEPDAQPVKPSKNNKPSVFNAALRAQFLSVSCEVLQPAPENLFGSPAFPAQPKSAELPVDSSNDNVTVKPSAGPVAQESSPVHSSFGLASDDTNKVSQTLLLHWHDLAILMVTWLCLNSCSQGMLRVGPEVFNLCLMLGLHF